MVEGTGCPHPHGHGAASSLVLSTPTPASLSKGKQKAGVPSFITPTAPGPPGDPWAYLCNTLRHLNTWDELPPETVQFLAQSMSANIGHLVSQLPKSRKPIVLLPEFQIPAAPVKIKLMAFLSEIATIDGLFRPAMQGVGVNTARRPKPNILLPHIPLVRVDTSWKEIRTKWEMKRRTGWTRVKGA
ncbi:hypothetical protein C8J57DRAFT_1253355 [Mycena rebaudengoi]|nr:hypothetical protein C8J57DRAFT_1253355 [Mycena rebaudengoi]